MRRGSQLTTCEICSKRVGAVGFAYIAHMRTHVREGKIFEVSDDRPNPRGVSRVGFVSAETGEGASSKGLIEKQAAKGIGETMSELAKQIVDAIDNGFWRDVSTKELAVDSVIQRNARTVCSFCGEFTFTGYIANGSEWTPEAREAIVAHARTCPKRPEPKLIARIERLEAALRNVLDHPSCADPDCCKTAIEHEAARVKARKVLEGEE